MCDMSQEGADRLALAVRAHRAHLGMTARQAAAKGEVSYGAWRNVEAGKDGVQPRTLAGVDRALGWPGGLAQKIAACLADPPPIDVPEPPVQSGPFVVERENGHTRLYRVTKDLPDDMVQDLADIAEIYRRRAMDHNG